MIAIIAKHILPAAFEVLPAKMNTAPARAMLLAIGLQESRFLHRRQTNYGPARGFWQFEKAGVRGVLKHSASRGPAMDVLRALQYEHLIAPPSFQIADLHDAIGHNDVLACAFARLLLWTLPGTLAMRGQRDQAWGQYLDAWRPGKPHRATWDALFEEAWTRVAIEELKP